MSFETIALFDQKTSRTCGIAAARSAIYLAKANDVGEDGIRKVLRQHRLPIFNYGIYYTYLCVILHEFGIPSEIYLHARTLAEFKVEHIMGAAQLRHLALAKQRKKGQSRDSEAFFRSIQLLDSIDAPYHLRSNSQLPNFRSLSSHLDRNRIVIVRVCSGEYYGIDGDRSGHTLVLFRWKGRRICADPYLRRGGEEYRNWSQHLLAARNFPWNKWSDDMVVIYSPPSLLYRNP